MLLVSFLIKVFSFINGWHFVMTYCANISIILNVMSVLAVISMQQTTPTTRDIARHKIICVTLVWPEVEPLPSGWWTYAPTQYLDLMDRRLMTYFIAKRKKKSINCFSSMFSVFKFNRPAHNERLQGFSHAWTSSQSSSSFFYILETWRTTLAVNQF